MLQTELNKVTIRPSADEPSVSPSTSSAPPAKKPRFSLFGRYNNPGMPSDSDERRHERQLVFYLDTINSASFSSTEDNMASLCCRSDFSALQPLFERILCSPASSAPVERVFSQSGLLVRPHRARMSDTLLEALMFLKCSGNV